VADAYDTVTIHSSAPVNLTLNYEFTASTTVPNSQPGTVTTFMRGQVFLFGNLQFIGGDNIFWAGDVTAPTGGGINIVPAGDASNGSSEFVTGSSTIRFWTSLADDFPESLVINRGFGGTQIVDADLDEVAHLRAASRFDQVVHRARSACIQPLGHTPG